MNSIIERKVRYEERQVKYAARSDCSLYKENDGNNIGDRLEGHKRGYQVLFSF